jgi:glutamate-1-semialdehyde 2,1-aminomutase
VFDEVVTGFRLSWGGAQEYFGVVPDLACYAKAIGGGFPVSAVAGRQDILSLANPTRFSGSEPVYFSGTLNGNPVGAAAGVATLELLREPGTYEGLWARSNRLQTEATAIAKRLGIAFQFAGCGPVMRSVFTDREIRTPADLRSGDAERNYQFCRGMLEQGVFFGPDKMYLTTAHSEDDIDRTLEACERTLKAIA